MLFGVLVCFSLQTKKQVFQMISDFALCKEKRFSLYGGCLDQWGFQHPDVSQALPQSCEVCYESTFHLIFTSISALIGHFVFKEKNNFHLLFW